VSVEIFNGTLDPNTAGPWVAVSESSIYSIQVAGSCSVEFSLDGVDAVLLGAHQEDLFPSLPSGSVRLYRVQGIPLSYMRVLAVQTTPQSVKVNVAVA